MNPINFQKDLDKKIAGFQEKGILPKLLLHSCCAPCSSYCLEYLSQYFLVTVLYYNPNIYPENEYRKRVMEQRQFIRKFPSRHPVTFIEGEYETGKFYKAVKGMEQCEEGKERCFACYRLRLSEAASLGKEQGHDYFTTTLSISPLKNAVQLNAIGMQIGTEYGIDYLQSDFKKKSGYQRSIALSREYGLYRQNYCGCVYSYTDQ